MKVRLPLTCLLAAGTLACIPTGSDLSATSSALAVSAPAPIAAHCVGLGEKMFMRIKDEGEQGVIREFLAQEEAVLSR